LGTGVTLLANLDPVRVAEDYATVDAISNGRVELSVGRGILVDTYEVFGQKPDESRERFRENLELLRRLWSETDVSWSGRFRAPLDRVTVEPRPVQAPHPPIWVGGGSSPASVDLAVELGLPLMLPSVLAPPADFLRWCSAIASAGPRRAAIRRLARGCSDRPRRGHRSRRPARRGVPHGTTALRGSLWTPRG
jgi:alkanesulfonate monooxygenase SsuD/methylene tetrahydromethanopterin reductase-like flavin-dependent oxidoreductase (luciferase family)